MRNDARGSRGAGCPFACPSQLQTTRSTDRVRSPILPSNEFLVRRAEPWPAQLAEQLRAGGGVRPQAERPVPCAPVQKASTESLNFPGPAPLGSKPGKLVGTHHAPTPRGRALRGRGVRERRRRAFSSLSLSFFLSSRGPPGVGPAGERGRRQLLNVHIVPGALFPGRAAGCKKEPDVLLCESI